MKLTIVGKTGRAQLTLSEEGYCVRLLPRNAHRSTSFAAGDRAYCGPDIEMAMLHIKAWTGRDDLKIPETMARGIN